MSSKINKLIMTKVFKRDIKSAPVPFSENMTAAWMIVSKTSVEPFAWNLETETLRNGRIVYCASIWGVYKGKVRSWDAREASMPLAICKAALK